ncbi:MAG: FAD-binding oxidoreductase [Rhodobacter sp.]|nr:FAD-binding oxidoreductase [Rhodobacter sp.]
MLNSVTKGFAAHLQSVVPGLATRDPAMGYLEEPRGSYFGQAGLVVAPGTTEEVAGVIRAAANARVPVVPYSGGTGLVGGQIVTDGPLPLILSLERMSAITAVYPDENVMVVQAGAILANVQAAAEQAGRLFPLSLASEGTARIGGLLGTNAGGVNVLRYGNARALCLGIEAVLPDGSIWHGMKRLRKDNTGYDLRDLLIGSEGTLGVITGASLRMLPRPSHYGAALMVVPSPRAALNLLGLAGEQMGEAVSAFELINGMGLQFIADTMPQVRQPFAEKPQWMALIDVGMSGAQDPRHALETLFETAAERDLVSDGLIAQSEGQRRDFWTVRESIPEANRRVGAIVSSDISLPLSSVAEFITRAGAVLAAMGEYRINSFGHMGDGNLHYNVYPMPGQTKADRIAEKPDIQRTLHDLVHAMDGSISAEHGIGRLKADDLQRYGDPAKLAAMRAIKDALDPEGIMNPGAVLPN